MAEAEPTAWDPEQVVRRLTRDRLGSYLATCRGDVSRALSLYDWNVELSGAVLGMLASVEVVVRNALDERLTEWAVARSASAVWFDTVGLDTQGSATLAKARSRATSFGLRPETHGRVVTELPFGFWRYLVANRYLTSLWVPALHAAFPHGPADLRERRARVERRLDRLLFVRNRVAHHEPVHRRDVLADVRAAVEVVGWICPDSAAWLAARSTVADVVRRRPDG